MLQKTALPPVLFVARSVIAGWAVFVPLMVFLGDGVSGTIGGVGWFLLALPVLMVTSAAARVLAGVRPVQSWPQPFATRRRCSTFGLSIGIFMSPVLFPINLFPGGWRWVLYLNPMTPLVLGYQSIMLQGQWPEPRIWMVALIWMLVLAGLLSTLLKRSREEIIDWL
jgi:lipopolysaccharide transport system permease protein